MSEAKSKPDSAVIQRSVAVALGSALLAVGFTVALTPTSGAPDFVQFFGRFHTLAIHLPIGVLLLVAAAEALCVVSPSKRGRLDPALDSRAPLSGRHLGGRVRARHPPRARRGLSLAAGPAPSQLHPRRGARLGGDPRRLGPQASRGVPGRARRHRSPAHGGRPLRRLDDPGRQLPLALRPALPAAAHGRGAAEGDCRDRQRAGDQRRAAGLLRRAPPDAQGALRRVPRPRSGQGRPPRRLVRRARQGR